MPAKPASKICCWSSWSVRRLVALVGQVRVDPRAWPGLAERLEALHVASILGHQCPPQTSRSARERAPCAPRASRTRPRFDRDPPGVEVDVVLPGDADATVDLHAVVDEVEAPVADVRLGHAHQAAGASGSSVVDRLGRARRLIAFENSSHIEHVGDAVLQRLERRDRPAEREAILRVLDGELEHAVGRADRLRALQRERDLELVLDRRRPRRRPRPRPPTRARARRRTLSDP